MFVRPETGGYHPYHYGSSVAAADRHHNRLGSTIEGSAFSGLLTRVEMGLGKFPCVPIGRRDDCAFIPSTCHFLIKETVDGLKWMGFGVGPSIAPRHAIVFAKRGSDECRLTHGDASEIEDVTMTAGHDAEGKITNSGDARKEPDIGSMNIEKVAQLAKLCAAGTPSDKDFKAIKERVSVAGNEVADENDRAHLVPKDWRTAEKAASSELPRDRNTGHDAFFQQIERARDKSDFSAELKAMESSIRVFPRPSSITSRTIGLFSTTALIGVGAMFAWHSHGDEAEEMVKRWTSSMGWVSSVSTKSPPAAAATTSPEIAQRPQTAAPDAATAHDSTEQPSAKQEQASLGIAAAQNIRSKTASPPQHARAKRTPVPETRPTTIEGWMLREVTDGTAVLEGPNGTWTVRRGDTVPGVGRVESIVLWGKRWIVATSKGLISTP